MHNYPNPKELGKILKECSRHGVSRIDLGSIKVEFGDTAKKLVRHSKKQKAVEEEANLQDEMDFKQKQLDDALVENPSLWEELSQKGDLDEDI